MKTTVIQRARPVLLLLILFLATQVTSLLMPPKSIPNLRIELFFRSTDELRERVRLLSSRGVKSFNLVNKSNRDNLEEWKDIIHEEVADSDVCVHYSLKYNKCRKKDGAFLLLKEFMNNMNIKSDASFVGKKEVLLVSGSGPKGRLNSVTALERLKSSQETHDKLFHKSKYATTMAVAFNPFFPSKEDLEIEKQRLQEKISTGQVRKIYLQFGTDLERLRSALEWLTNLRKDHDELSICGSIFLPTKKLIAQQKFRPWNGVFLCEEFLNSEDDAKGIVLCMMRLYEKYGCEILIEAPGVRSENDMNMVDQLLADRDATNEDGTSNNIMETDGANILNTDVESKTKQLDDLLTTSAVTVEALQTPAIVLFGSHDIRLHDNVAIQLASFHSNVIPAFIWSRREQKNWGVTGAAEVVLKDALINLKGKLEGHGLNLICREAENSADELYALCRESGASAVYLNKEHTTESRTREKSYRKILENKNIQLIECQSSLLYDPTNISLKSGFNGGHWGTLMPFLKACKKNGEPRRPIARYKTLSLLDGMNGPLSWPHSLLIENLDLANIKGAQKWDLPIKERFPMSEEDALMNMNNFLNQGLRRYEKERNRSDVDWSTSKLSAHLRIGTLSPNELYYKVEDSNLHWEDKKTFSRRLFWRDLAYFQLLHFPAMRESSIRSHYDDTEWVSGAEEERRFEAWKKGKTGYPLVDAGMRELYATGWMTQSIRMIVASFLTEYLRVNWVKGCEWFHYTLVDADSAINAMMWQNAGRSGIDQWNFVMSPVAASQDLTGSYTKRWVPELSKLSKPLLHRPWDAPKEVLEEAGIILGETYPQRIISDLESEKEISDNNVLSMRRRHQNFNDGNGYDLVDICGISTTIFTKKQFRIDREGNLIKSSVSKSKFKRKGEGSKAPKHGFRRHKKLSSGKA